VNAHHRTKHRHTSKETELVEVLNTDEVIYQMHFVVKRHVDIYYWMNK